jgi:hypothetical protein
LGSQSSMPFQQGSFGRLQSFKLLKFTSGEPLLSG